MKKIITAVFLLLPSLLFAQNYELVWHDEFDVDGVPNPEIWTYENGFIRNNEEQWYQGDNAEVRDGVLVITAKREKVANPNYVKGSKNWRTARDSAFLTSCSATTYGHKSLLYGRLLVRARIPVARGTWPAIWMLGNTRNFQGLKDKKQGASLRKNKAFTQEELQIGHRPWPACGEVDILESYPVQGAASLHANACWLGPNNSSKWNAKRIPIAHFTERDSLWATQFHVWRMDWTKEYIRIYVDDELLNDIDIRNCNNGEDNGKNPFHSPMYLLLNLAMGSTGGKVDDDALPARYEIDYVRYYKLKE